MATIKNTSKKIINIGTTPLMPDDSMEVSAAIAESPAIKAMAGLGQLTVSATKPARKKGEDDAAKKAEEEAAKKAAEEQAAKEAEEAARKAAEAKKKAEEEAAAKKAEEEGAGKGKTGK